MSNYTPIDKRVYVSTLYFSSLNPESINQFECVNGERAGFRLERFVDYEDGKEIIISYVYDCTDSEPIYLSSISILPETDLVGGLFSSGVFASGSPFDTSTIFRKINY